MRADEEYQRIKSLSAFNVAYSSRKVLNQHSVQYSFCDGSKLKISFSKRYATVIDPNGKIVAIGNRLNLGRRIK